MSARLRMVPNQDSWRCNPVWSSVVGCGSSRVGARRRLPRSVVVVRNVSRDSAGWTRTVAYRKSNRKKPKRKALSKYKIRRKPPARNESMAVSSWTGSERQRRPQRAGHAPEKPMDSTSRFTIPVGASVLIQRISDGTKWNPHTTKRLLEFERYELFKSGYYHFREQGWFVKVWNKAVIQRS